MANLFIIVAKFQNRSFSIFNLVNQKFCSKPKAEFQPGTCTTLDNP